MRKMLFWGFIITLVVSEITGCLIYKFTGFNDDLPKFFWMFPFILLGIAIVIAGIAAITVGKSFFGSNPKGTKTAPTDTTKPADSKDSKTTKDTTTTKTVVEKKSGSGKKWWTPIAQLFALIFTLFMISIVVWYTTGNHRLADLKNGKGIGGIIPTMWEMAFKSNPDSAEIALKFQKERNRFVLDSIAKTTAEPTYKNQRNRGILGDVVAAIFGERVYDKSSTTTNTTTTTSTNSTNVQQSANNGGTLPATFNRQQVQQQPVQVQQTAPTAQTVYYSTPQGVVEVVQQPQ